MTWKGIPAALNPAQTYRHDSRSSLTQTLLILIPDGSTSGRRRGKLLDQIHLAIGAGRESGAKLRFASRAEHSRPGVYYSRAPVVPQLTRKPFNPYPLISHLTNRNE